MNSKFFPLHFQFKYLKVNESSAQNARISERSCRLTNINICDKITTKKMEVHGYSKSICDHSKNFILEYTVIDYYVSLLNLQTRKSA